VNGIEAGIVYDLNRASEKPDANTPVDNANCGGNLTTLADFDDWANILLTGLSDTDGKALRPFRIIDCNNPMLSRELRR